MKRLAILLAAGLFAASAHSAETFALKSAQIAPGATITEAQVFKGFGCSGGNVSPSLSWSHAPAGTKSFALMVHDPDAPTGSGWWHWVVFDIPASATSLDLGAGTADGAKLPAGSKQGVTDFGAPGYGGPCPPIGDKPHRYYFRLFALKVEKLEVPATASPAMIGFMVNANAIGRAELLGLYGR